MSIKFSKTIIFSKFLFRLNKGQQAIIIKKDFHRIPPFHSKNFFFRISCHKSREQISHNIKIERKCPIKTNKFIINRKEKKINFLHKYNFNK